MRDAGLQIVDPINCCDSAMSLEGLVVYSMPGQLVHTRAPNDGRLARVAECHDKSVELGQFDRAPRSHPNFHFHPIGLSLRGWWSFDSSKRSLGRLRKPFNDVLLDCL
jgi:hypothetical protein